jgi:hypothetical protein
LRLLNSHSITNLPAIGFAFGGLSEIWWRGEEETKRRGDEETKRRGDEEKKRATGRV